MNSRRYSKTLKKQDLININKLLEDENEILKKEIGNMAALLRSQDERQQTEIKSLITENEILSKTNSQLVELNQELQESLKPLRNINSEYLYKKDQVNRSSLSSRSIKNKENYCEPTKSLKVLKKQQISPLKAGLLQDSRKLLALVSKMKRLQKN